MYNDKDAHDGNEVIPAPPASDYEKISNSQLYDYAAQLPGAERFQDAMTVISALTRDELVGEREDLQAALRVEGYAVSVGWAAGYASARLKQLLHAVEGHLAGEDPADDHPPEVWLSWPEPVAAGETIPRSCLSTPKVRSSAFGVTRTAVTL
jgi:hypothetical protein